jgi:hypothetical protein
MVEMLMTAFILAVGIMGLTLLQVMSLRGARGGRSLSTAVQVGEMVMDQIEMEGRLSWLNITASKFAAPAALTTLRYVNQVPAALPTATSAPFATFTIKGEVPLAGAADPIDSTPFYNVAIGQTNNTGLAATGVSSDFVVQVQFSDQADPAGAKIYRYVTITRRILHG